MTLSADSKPTATAARFVLPALLAIITFAVYSQVRTHNFVNLDDPDYVSSNAIVQSGLNAQSIRWAFTQVHSSNWHPLTWMSHMLDCQLFGVKPAGHHLVNVAFHLANTLLLFCLLQRLTGGLWRSLFVAALFALHPLHVESVAWVSERKDVLSTFFGLLTLIAYARYAAPSSDRGRIHWYALALCFFALGLLSKPMLVTWPFVLLLLDVWPLNRFSRDTSRSGWSHIIIEKLPFFALTIASCIVTILAQGGAGATVSTGHLPVAARLAQIPVSYMRYLGKMFWPENLAAFYPYEVYSWDNRAVLGSALVLIAITVLALLNFRSRTFLAIGWFWFLGTLVPVIGLVQVGRQSIADRYTYIPLIGIFMAVVWLVADFFERARLPRSFRFAAATFVLGICAFLTVKQVSYWRNTVSLARHATAVNPNNYIGYAQIASELATESRYDEARAEVQRALALKPDFAEAHNIIAFIHARQTNYDAATFSYREAIRCDPTFPDAYVGLADVYFKLSNFAEAEKLSSEAVRRWPTLLAAWNLLAQSQHNLGKYPEAIASYQRLSQLKPGLFSVQRGLATALALNGNLPAAIAEFEKALSLQPRNVETRTALAMVLLSKGNTSAGSNQLALALSYEPTNAIANYQMGTVMAGNRQPAAAAKHYRVALEAHADWPEALNNFAWLLAASANSEVRNGAEAVKLAERACSLTDYKVPFFVGTLAAAYAEAGRFEDAVTTAEKAEKLATAAGLTEVAEKNRQLLALYRSGKPYHETE